MGISEKHQYAAAALMGISLLGEAALLLRMSTITVFYASVVGGVSGVYFYSHFRDR